jgi:hypothetical protein
MTRWYSAASVPVYRLCVMCHGRGLYIWLPSESNGGSLRKPPLKTHLQWRCPVGGARAGLPPLLL